MLLLVGGDLLTTFVVSDIAGEMDALTPTLMHCGVCHKAWIAAVEMLRVRLIPSIQTFCCNNYLLSTRSTVYRADWIS